MTTTTALVLIAVCVLLQGFFSGSEIALVSADRLRLKGDADKGRRGSARVLKLLDNPTLALGTCLVGTNVSTISSATLAAALVGRHLGPYEPLAVFFLAPLTLTMGEMVPKALYQQHADKIAPIVALPLEVVSLVISPVLWIINAIAHLLGGNVSASHPAATREEIMLLLEHGKNVSLKASDKAFIRRVFAFTEADVEDAMVPLIEVIAVPETTTCAQVVHQMKASGHSRLPIYSERIDQITGVVLHHDLLDEQTWTRPVSEVARAPLFVPESKPVAQLLPEMQRNRYRLAVAVDEYGGAVGIITVEDLLEEIVGDILDESDRDQNLVRRSGARMWLASGRAEREHLEAACGLLLPDGDFETLAGFILVQTARIPRVGDKLEIGEFIATVTRANDRAILEVALRKQGR